MGEYSLADDVLFIGHSLVGVEVPAMLQDTVEGQGGAGSIRFQVINGAPLVWNWDNSAKAQGVDARATLPEGDTEVVVMTEAIPLINHTTWNATNENALKFYDLAVASNPETRVYLYETWHSLDSGTGADVPHDDGDDVAWRARLDADLPRWEAIVAYVNARREPGEPPMRLAPVGQAMAALHDEILRGGVPGVTDIRQLFRDDIHPNSLGGYFVAMVQYATLYGRDPRGLPRLLHDAWGRAFEAPAPALAARLQEIAWDVVTTYPLKGGRAELDASPPAEVKVKAEAEASAEVARGARELAMGLAGISDWSTQQPFVDVMKSARPWIGHLPGRWGGWGHAELAAGGLLDDRGWPRRIPAELTGISTIVLSDQPEEAASLAGRYRLTYAGEGAIRVEGRGRVVRQRDGEIVFDFEPGGGHVTITIAETDPRGAGDHIRDVAIIKESNAAIHAEGAAFNPLWLDRIDGLGAVRFMDWMKTNDSPITEWSERPRQLDYTYARNGVPLEVMVDLANLLGVDPWFTMPHQADDGYLRAFAEAVRDRLDPALKTYVEYSNEVWNWQFEQAGWARDAAVARWGPDAPGDAFLQFAGQRAAQMARIWDAAFAGEADGRLVKVIATQTGWLGLERSLLEAPLWVAEDPARNRAPATEFDAYAVTGYFGSSLGREAKAPQVQRWIAESRAAAETAATARGLTGAERAAYLAEHEFDASVALAAAELRDGSVTGDPAGSLGQLLCEFLPYQAEVAGAHGLDLIMYEGGTHVVGVGPRVNADDLTAFFSHLNYTPEMAGLYGLLRSGWAEAGGTLFNAFVDVAAPGKWGSWGALRHLDDANPRWDALFSEVKRGAVCPIAQATADRFEMHAEAESGRCSAAVEAVAAGEGLPDAPVGETGSC